MNQENDKIWDGKQAKKILISLLHDTANNIPSSAISRNLHEWAQLIRAMHSEVNEELFRNFLFCDLKWPEKEINEEIDGLKRKFKLQAFE